MHHHQIFMHGQLMGDILGYKWGLSLTFGWKLKPKSITCVIKFAPFTRLGEIKLTLERKSWCASLKH